MPNFNSCVYGPWRVRPVLRAHLEPAERVVAWGLTHRPATSASNLFAIAISLTPFVGPFLAPAVLKRNPRLLVLTDRRVLFLRTDRKPANRKGRLDRTAVALDSPLEEILVQSPTGGTSFELRMLSSESTIRVEIPDQKGRPAERLREALALLAKDELSAAAHEEKAGAAPGRRTPVAASPWEGRIPE